MTDFLCLNCMTWAHESPMCSHDPAQLCIGCNKPVGYRFMADDGKLAGSPFRCSRCHWGKR